MSTPEELPPEQRTTGAPPHPLLKRLHQVVPILAVGLLAVLSREELRGLDWGALHNALRHLSVGRLLLLQLAGLVAVAGMLGYDRVLVHCMAVPMPTAQLLRMSWVANTFNNFVGLSGLTGSGIRYFALTRSGTTGGTAAAYSLLLMLSLPVGLSLLALPALAAGPAALASTGLSPRSAQLGLLLVFAYLPAFLLVAGSAPLLRRFGDTIPPLNRTARFLLTAVSTIDWLLAMGVLALALWSVGAPFTPGVLVIGFVAAGVAGILSLMPGGLGVFDATFLLVLTAHGAASEPVAVALLLYRLVYFVVPWVIGAGLGLTALAGRIP